MQVKKLISAPVQRAGQFINKTGKATVAAVAIAAAALGAKAENPSTTNNVQQAATKPPVTLKAVSGVGGFTPWIYTDIAAMSNKSVKVTNGKLNHVIHTNIPASNLKLLGSKNLEQATRDFQEVGTIIESKTSHTDPKYGLVYEYKVEYPVGYRFGMINANNVSDKNGVAIKNIPSFEK